MANFYMMIGLPGSGKTDYANLLASKDTVIISSDAIRKEFYGDESIQDAPEKIFEEMQRRTISALKNDNNVIYDATNISRKRRKHLLSSLQVSCKKIACVVWARYETCVERDKARQRNVGESVIRRMILNFQTPYYDEGWDEIILKVNDNLYIEKDYLYWMDCEHDNPHHNNTIAEHSLKVVAKVHQKEFDEETTNLLFYSANLHDIGKRFTKAYKDSRGNPTKIAHYYGHHNVGAYFAIGYDLLQDFPIEYRALICWIINNHMEPFFQTKYYKTLNERLKFLLDALHECDVEGA